MDTDTGTTMDQLLDAIHEQTPDMHIPRDLSISECLRRAGQSARFSVAGRFAEALAVCVAPPTEEPAFSEG